MRLKVAVPKKKFNVEQLARAKDPTLPMSKVPQIMRFGPGSLDDQIRSRTHFAQDGARIPWQEPEYASGATAFSRHELLEDIMWDAVRGGPGSITRSSSHAASVGVNDQIVRTRSAELGNQIVSTASYFGFVTGGCQERTSSARAKPSKPTKSGRGEFPRNKAMWWFLRLNFNYSATAEELSSGIVVPPKNMGFNPVMLERVRKVILSYILTGRAF